MLRIPPDVIHTMTLRSHGLERFLNGNSNGEWARKIFSQPEGIVRETDPEKIHALLEAVLVVRGELHARTPAADRLEAFAEVLNTYIATLARASAGEDTLTIELTVSEARALAQAAMIGRSTMRKAMRSQILDDAMSKVDKSLENRVA